MRKFSMKNTQIRNKKLIEQMMDEKIILDSLRLYHQEHIKRATFNPYHWKGQILADEFNKVEERLARLTQQHTSKFIQLNKKIDRKMK